MSKDYAFAEEFATKAHTGQVRKGYRHEPYVEHPKRAVNRLKKHGITEEDLLVALVLHDTVEDTEVTIEEIYSTFGDRVGDLVSTLTKNPDEQKGEYIKRFRTASVDAVLLKLADRLDNLWDAHTISNEFAKDYCAKTMMFLSCVIRNKNVEKDTTKGKAVREMSHELYWLIQQIVWPETYDHSVCNGNDEDACKCGHSRGVFHAGGPCFHVNEAHEYIAITRADLEFIPLKGDGLPSNAGYLKGSKKDFCNCDGDMQNDTMSNS